MPRGPAAWPSESSLGPGLPRPFGARPQLTDDSRSLSFGVLARKRGKCSYLPVVFRTPDSAGRALSAWCLSCGQNPLPSGYFCYHLPLRAALPEPCRRQRPEARRLRLPGGSRGRRVACQEPRPGGEGVGEERFRKVMQYSVSHPSPSPIIAKYLKFK